MKVEQYKINDVVELIKNNDGLLKGSIGIVKRAQENYLYIQVIKAVTYQNKNVLWETSYDDLFPNNDGYGVCAKNVQKCGPLLTDLYLNKGEVLDEENKERKENVRIVKKILSEANKIKKDKDVPVIKTDLDDICTSMPWEI